MDNTREEIDQYLALWDQARKHFPPEKKVTPPNVSFYGMQRDASEDELDEEDGEHWRDVYYRSLEIDGMEEEEILTEAEEPKKKASAKKKKKSKKSPKKDARAPKDGEAPDLEEDEDGFGKDLADGPGKDVKFKVNPITFSSAGDDTKLRVTPNWTDGKELRQLAKLKSLLYDLESEMIGTEVRGKNADSIRVKLLGIQKQCEALSQKLIPDVKHDVS
jgi:hypothetical protein